MRPECCSGPSTRAMETHSSPTGHNGVQNCPGGNTPLPSCVNRMGLGMHPLQQAQGILRSPCLHPRAAWHKSPSPNTAGDPTPCPQPGMDTQEQLCRPSGTQSTAWAPPGSRGCQEAGDLRCHPGAQPPSTILPPSARPLQHLSQRLSPSPRTPKIFQTSLPKLLLSFSPTPKHW